MSVLAIEVPASAARRERRQFRSLMAVALLGVFVAVWFGDVALPRVDGFVIITIAIVIGVQTAAAIRFYALARSSGERTYLYLGAGSQFVALMGVPWAFTSSDVIGAQAAPETAALAGFVRLSIVAGYAVCLGLAAVVYRSDHPHYPRMRPVRRPDPAILVDRTAIGVGAVALMWVAGLLAFAGLLPPPVSLSGTVSAYPSTAWLVVLLTVACIGMVLPSYLTNAALFAWDVTMLVAVACAMTCGIVTETRYTLSWYATYACVLVSVGALLLMLPRLTPAAATQRQAHVGTPHRARSHPRRRRSDRRPPVAIRDIEERQLQLVYQPILDLCRGGVWGFEALLRLELPDGTRRAAGEFLDDLVATVGARRVGTVVLDHLARDLPTVTKTQGARVSVNMSAAELSDPVLVDRIRSGDLARYAGRLVVEVAQDTFAVPPAAAALADLQEAGVTVAVDDYGSGRSNVALLVAARPQVLKIDREFTASISEHGSAVIRSAVSLARGLHSVVVAKGVETPAQESALSALGVRLGQGYALGRPLALERSPLSY